MNRIDLNEIDLAKSEIKLDHVFNAKEIAKINEVGLTQKEYEQLMICDPLMEWNV